MPNKPPAFQFYPRDWLGSMRVAEMSLEEEGAYIRLLCYCWNNGSVPADPEACARVIGKGACKAVAIKVLVMFDQHPTESDRLIHERLEEEREKQRLWREKSAKGGKASAEGRNPTKGQPKGNQSPKGGSTTLAPLVDDCLQPKGNSSSSNKKEYVADDFSELTTFWNKSGLPKIRNLSDTRKKRLRQRMSEENFRDNWREAIDRLKNSTFCMGGGNTGWKANFNWFLNPDMIDPILEGNYDNKTKSGDGKPGNAPKCMPANKEELKNWSPTGQVEETVS